MKWQPIDSAPKDGTVILAWSPTHGAYTAWNKGRGWHSEPGVYHRRPTHWMPISETPQAVSAVDPVGEKVTG